MEVKEKVQEEIMKALSGIGMNGATITEIEKNIDFERHTLSKYLSFMEGHGLIFHKKFGKAKVWFINNAPIKTVLNSLPEKKTFTERILSDIITNIPLGLIVIDKDYNIIFQNEKALKSYGNKEGKKFYIEILGLENPLKLRKITDLIWGKSKNAVVTLNDRNNSIINLSASLLLNPDKSESFILLLEDITEIEKQKKLLEAEREALNKSAILVETDVNGKITYVNDKFLKLSGYSRKELLGKTHKLVNSKHHTKQFFKEMWETISSGKVWVGKIKNKSKDGSYYWLESAIAPVLKDGKPIKYIAVRFDVSKYVKNK